MIFDVLSSAVHFGRRENRAATASLSFDVVPHGRNYIDIGDSHVLIGLGYHRMFAPERTPVAASITIAEETPDDATKAAEKLACGYATFSPARDDAFEDVPAKIFIVVTVDSARFAELRAISIHTAGTATISVDIDGLKYGWEPDGSHQIWNLDDVEGLGRPRLVKGFSIGVETFWCDEGAIRTEEDRRLNLELAQSPDESDRKLAETLAKEAHKPDPLERLLNQCRLLLIVLVALAGLALFRHS